MLAARAKKVSGFLLYELGGETHLHEKLHAFNIGCGTNSITHDAPYLKFQLHEPSRNGADLIVIYHSPDQETYCLEMWSLDQVRAGSHCPLLSKGNLTLQQVTDALEEHLGVPLSPLKGNPPTKQ